MDASIWFMIPIISAVICLEIYFARKEKEMLIRLEPSATSAPSAPSEETSEELDDDADADADDFDHLEEYLWNHCLDIRIEVIGAAREKSIWWVTFIRRIGNITKIVGRGRGKTMNEAILAAKERIEETRTYEGS